MRCFGFGAQAEYREIKALINQGTYIVIPRSQVADSMEVIGCKWVCTVKGDALGFVIKLKVQLCAHGNQQLSKFLEMFVPTAMYTSIHFFLATAAGMGWKMCALDVFSAYLHIDLPKVVYMRPPPGHSDKKDDMLMLKKSLYSLCHAGHKWA